MQSMASIRRHQILSMAQHIPNHIGHRPSVSQLVNHMNRFRLRFVFDSNQFVWHFWLFHPLSLHLTLLLKLTSEWAVFGMLFVRLIFVVVVRLLYRFCILRFQSRSRKTAAAVAAAAAKQTLPSHRVACCIFKYAFPK